jgi:hypothetical protein
MWYRAEKLGEPIDEQFERIVENYLAFIREIRAQGFERLFVLSAPAPTIKHAEDWTGPTHPRQQIDVSQRDRTDLTLRYNDELSRRAGDYTFVDVTRPTLDPATGFVAEEFVNADKRDHHLSPEPYGRVIAERLGPHLGPP